MCDGAVYPSLTGLSTLAGTSWQRTQVGSCVLTHAKPNSGAGGLQGPPGLLLASLQVWLLRPAPACFAGAKNYTEPPPPLLSISSHSGTGHMMQVL